MRISGITWLRPSDLRLFPSLRPAQCPLPSLRDLDPCRRFHCGLEALVDLPLTRNVRLILPEPDSQTREICGAKCCRLCNLGSDDWHVQQVRLQLHQEIVRAGSSINA